MLGNLAILNKTDTKKTDDLLLINSLSFEIFLDVSRIDGVQGDLDNQLEMHPTLIS